MKNKRLKKGRAIWLRRTAYLLLALIPISCCLVCFFPRFIQEPPKTIGVRRDAQGKVVQEIVYQQSYWHIADLPGHTRPFRIALYSHKCFLEEPGKLRRELTFLAHEHMSAYPDRCKPVNDTRLWVRAGFFEPGSNLSVLVFDEDQIVHRASLQTTALQATTKSGKTFWFENGNRTLVYRAVQGLEAYDVITGGVGPWKPDKN